MAREEVTWWRAERDTALHLAILQWLKPEESMLLGSLECVGFALQLPEAHCSKLQARYEYSMPQEVMAGSSLELQLPRSCNFSQVCARQLQPVNGG